MSNDIEREAFVWPSDIERAENDELNRVCEYAEQLHDELYAARAQQGVAEPVVWNYCPECGSEDATEHHGSLRVCTECGQDWHTSVDYTATVRGKLRALHTQPPTATAGGVPSRDDLIQCLLATQWQPEGVTADAILSMLAAAPSPEQPKPTNRYGVDAPYFHGKLSLVLRDLENYTPDELARSLARLVVVADKNVLAEPEFTPEQSQAAPGSGWIRCSERMPNLVGHYDAYTPTDGGRYPDAYWDGERWEAEMNGIPIRGVTHYCSPEIPNPPAEGDLTDCCCGENEEAWRFCKLHGPKPEGE